MAKGRAGAVRNLPAREKIARVLLYLAFSTYENDVPKTASTQNPGYVPMIITLSVTLNALLKIPCIT